MSLSYAPAQVAFLLRALAEFCVCAAATSVLAASDTTSALNYSVTIDPHDSTVASISLHLPPPRTLPRTLKLRGTDWGLEPQIEMVACDGQAMPKGADGTWLARPECRQVTWRLRFRIADDLSVNASSQGSVYFPSSSWWLISEPTALLRLKDLQEPAFVTFHYPKEGRVLGSVQEPGRNAWRVPSENNAPEFYAVGRFASRTVDIGGMRVSYAIDDIQRFSRNELASLHTKVLGYLLEVVALPKQRLASDRALSVIWLGIGATKRQIAGAAGSRTFVANYLVGPDTDIPLNRVRTMYVVAHEQFHQLVDVARDSLEPLPVWISESLATYYGLKAIGASGEDANEVSRVRGEFLRADTPIKIGLLEANRRYKNAGDKSVYSDFYSQGAMFWYEIDKMIQQSSAGRASLDHMIPSLFRQSFPASGEIPEGFLSELRQQNERDTARILQKYVGQ